MTTSTPFVEVSGASSLACLLTLLFLLSFLPCSVKFPNLGRHNWKVAAFPTDAKWGCAGLFSDGSLSGGFPDSAGFRCAQNCIWPAFSDAPVLELWDHSWTWSWLGIPEVLLCMQGQSTWRNSGRTGNYLLLIELYKGPVCASKAVPALAKKFFTTLMEGVVRLRPLGRLLSAVKSTFSVDTKGLYSVPAARADPTGQGCSAFLKNCR